jgi:NAD-reducing hydrogenase small subunit
MSATPKIKVATMWLSGCSGCHMSFLDLDERLIDLAKLVEFTASPITDLKEIPPVDVGLVEGCVNNNEQELHVKDLRAKCKVLIAIGDCAIMGNVPAIRNQFKLQDCLTRGYVETESTMIGEIPTDPIVPRLLPKARPVKDVVKVDAYIPGCPPDADTIWYALTELLAGRMPKWDETKLRYD